MTQPSLKQTPLKAGYWEFIVLIAIVFSIESITVDAMMPSLSVITDQLGAKFDNQMQWLIQIFFLGFGLGSLIFAPITDFLGRKKILLLGLALFLISSLFAGLSSNLIEMLTWRFLQGVATGATIIANAIIRDRYQGRQMAKVFSLGWTFFTLFPVIAPPIGELIARFSHWRAIFVVLVVMTLAIMAWIALRLEETLPIEKRDKFSFKNLQNKAQFVLTHPITMAATIANGLLFGAYLAFWSASVQIYEDLYNITDWLFALLALEALVMALASWLNSRLVIRFGMIRLTYAFLVVCMVCAFGVWALAFMNEGIVSFVIFVAFMVCYSFAGAIVFINFDALTLHPLGEVAGVGSSISAFISLSLAAVLGALIGATYDQTLHNILFCLGLSPLVAMLLVKAVQFKTPHLDWHAEPEEEL